MRKKGLFVVSLLLLGIAVPTFAQNTYSNATQTTTLQASAAPYCTPWVDSGVKAPAAWTTSTSYLEIFPDIQFQPILGWGATFQDMAWDAMGHLSATGKDSIVRALFDTSGCALNWGRIPVGCCDYDKGVAPYSCNDSAGDFDMTAFSMTRDSVRRLPFIKAAQALQPNMRFFASPWSPPGWMKSTNSYSGGSFKNDANTMAAYALYLSKWLTAYKTAGINVETITCQNEPDQTAGKYPQCGWTQVQEDTFYRNYMIPQFKKDNQTARILIGVYCCGAISDWVTPFLKDTVVGPFVNYTSHSYETTNWGHSCVALTTPHLPFIETESAWSPGDETWSTAAGIFKNIQAFMIDSCYMYTIWNCAGNSTGKGAFAGSSLGSQPLMITIDTNSGKVVYSPYYFACKHYSHFVKAGAHLVKSTGTGLSSGLSGSVYKNPNGDIVYVVYSTGNTTFNVKIGQQAYTVTLPANSFNTVVFPNSTPTAVQSGNVQKNAAAALSDVRISNSTLYFSLSSAVKARQMNLALVDMQGKTVWTGHSTPGALQSRQGIAIRAGQSQLRSGVYLLSVKLKDQAGAVSSFEQKVTAVN